jgi:hypothetical protein
MCKTRLSTILFVLKQSHPFSRYFISNKSDLMANMCVNVPQHGTLLGSRRVWSCFGRRGISHQCTSVLGWRGHSMRARYASPSMCSSWRASAGMRTGMLVVCNTESTEYPP